MGRKVGRYVSTHVWVLCVRIFKACTSTSRYRHPVDFPQQRFLILYTVKATKHAYLARQSSTVLLPACSLQRPDIDAIRLPAILGGSALLWWLPCLPGNRWAAAVGHAIVWCAPVQSRAGAVASVRLTAARLPHVTINVVLWWWRGQSFAKGLPKGASKGPAQRGVGDCEDHAIEGIAKGLRLELRGKGLGDSRGRIAKGPAAPGAEHEAAVAESHSGP